jgi:hypothetical protein
MNSRGCVKSPISSLRLRGVARYEAKQEAIHKSLLIAWIASGYRPRNDGDLKIVADQSAGLNMNNPQ